MPQDTTPGDTLFVVYQFGKVASTSIVKTMQKVDGIDAHQSHFLGEYALKRIVNSAVDPANNEYFHHHTVGQFMTNLELTYRMNKVLSGADDRRLVVMSLTREPLDWLRSSVQQDIRGYEADIFAYAKARGITRDSEDALMEAALIDMIAALNRFLKAKGGFGAVLTDIRKTSAEEVFAGTLLAKAAILRKLYFLAVRPLVWFDEHFKLSCGVDYRDMHSQGDIRYLHQDRASYVILPYENLKESLGPALKIVDLPEPKAVARENISAKKPYSKQIRAAFEGTDALLLRKFMSYSDYARQFGYSEDVTVNSPPPAQKSNSEKKAS